MSHRPGDRARQPVIELRPVQQARHAVDGGVVCERCQAPSSSQCHGDACDQFLGVERLRHVVDGARFEPENAVPRHRAAGEEDHRRGRRIAGRQGDAEVMAVQHRHGDVEYQQVGIVLRRKLQGLVAVPGGYDAVPGAFQPHADEQADVVIIVGNENQRRGGHAVACIGPNHTRLERRARCAGSFSAGRARSPTWRDPGADRRPAASRRRARPRRPPWR